MGLALLGGLASLCVASDGALLGDLRLPAGGVTGGVALGADGSVYFGTRREAPGLNASLMVLRGGKLEVLFTCSDDIDACPVVGADGSLYFGSWNGVFYALSADGSLRWSRDVGRFISSSAVADSAGNLYFGAGDGALHALSPDGVERWRHPTGGWVESSPALSSLGRLFFGSWDGRIYSIDTNGVPCWSRDCGGRVLSSPALSRGGAVFAATSEGAVLAMEQATGALLWRVQLPAGTEASPVLDSAGRLVIGDLDGTLHVLDVQTGRTVWSRDLGGEITGTVAVRADGAYVCPAGRTLWCLSASGAVLWSLDGGALLGRGPLLTPSGALYVGTQGPSLLYVESASGLSTAADWAAFHGGPARAGKQQVETPTRLSNISMRGMTGAGVLAPTVGITVSGAAGLPVLLRAVGPGLVAFGVSGAVVDPKLVLNVGSSRLLENDNWDGASSLGAVFEALGAFGLLPGSLDAALLHTLPAGNYTIVPEAGGGREGIVLVEAFEAGGPGYTRLSNLSVRALAGSGDQVLIAGFVVAGSKPLKVLVRAIGPGLKPFGLSSVLEDPLLTLYSGTTLIAENDDWGKAADAALLSPAVAAAGAFALPEGSRDASLVLTLEPGIYSCVCSGKGGATGLAMLEVYSLE